MKSKFLVVIALAAIIPSLRAERNTDSVRNTDLVRSMIFLDTAESDKYKYNTFFRIAKLNSFRTKYCPVESIIDSSPDEIGAGRYDCALFLFCNEFLESMESSFISKKVLSILEKFSRLPNKITILLLPPVGSHNNISHFQKYLNLGTDESSKRFVRQTNKHLSIPHEKRHIAYHTTLMPPHYGPSANEHQTISDRMETALLPIKNRSFPARVKNLFPLATCMCNKATNSYLIVAFESFFSGFDISENFKLCPMDEQLKAKLVEALNELVFEVHSISSQENDPQGINDPPGIDTKKIFATQRKPIVLEPSTRTLKGKKRNIAWMELNHTEKQISTLAEHILAARISDIWLTINPQELFGVRGRRRNQVKPYLKKLAYFTKSLSMRATEQGVPPPALLIGIEIANNLTKDNLPVPCAYSAYETKFDDIPQPLDRRFMHQTIVNPVKTFMRIWRKKHGLSNGIKIRGVVIDQEMYMRKQCSSYSNTVGFHNNVIGRFLGKESGTIRELADKKMCSKFYVYIGIQAKNLGRHLSSALHEEIPNSTIYCYTPHIFTGWYYKNLYSGLSSPGNPLYILSFNTTTKKHKKWFTNNDIQHKHGSVIMLSKLRTKKDFLIFKSVFSKNDAGWTNRLSRSVEIKPPSWADLERIRVPMEKRKNIGPWIRDALREVEFAD